MDGTNMKRRVNKNKQNLQTDYLMICEELPNFCEKFSEKEFIAMHLGVESRQLNNNKNGLYSAPLVDYMNHDEDSNAGVMMDD